MMTGDVSYILPIRSSEAVSQELVSYLQWLSKEVALIIVDGSAEPIFSQHAAQWATLDAIHIAPDPEYRLFANGKVGGVLTGLKRVQTPLAIVADDDVRYDAQGLAAMRNALERADVVRPQNYFHPLPWHACLDTARTLLNRISGGDWPGTLGVRSGIVMTAGGYDGDVLFENLELVRTVIAAGGSHECPLDLYVRRLPPSTGHFWSQRVRQAYDEIARPLRLAVWLAVLPGVTLLAATGHAWIIAVGCGAAIVAAEAGRWRSGGRRFFPARAAWLAPLWIAERAVCSWLAVAAWTIWGGIPYRGRIVTRAATPMRRLQRRLQGA